MFTIVHATGIAGIVNNTVDYLFVESISQPASQPAGLGIFLENGLQRFTNNTNLYVRA